MALKLAPLPLVELSLPLVCSQNLPLLSCRDRVEFNSRLHTLSTHRRRQVFLQSDRRGAGGGTESAAAGGEMLAEVGNDGNARLQWGRMTRQH